MPRRRSRRLLAALVVAILLIVGIGDFDYRHILHPPSDTAIKADVIMTIGGDDEEGRSALALHLLGQGIAPLLVTDIPGIPRYGFTCADPRIMCIRPLPFSTQGEARALKKLAQQRDWRTVLLIVSRDQAYRARLRFHRCFAGDLRVLTVPTNYALWYHVAYEDAALVKAEVWQRSC